MKKIVLLFIILSPMLISLWLNFSLLIVACFSQPSITWQRLYGSAIGTEYFFSVVQVPDIGFIAVGVKYGGYILRTNKFGDTLWTKIYPGTSFTMIQLTHDNQYALTGSAILLAKMDINGNILWTKPKYNNSTYTYRFKETADKGFIFVGYLDSGYYNYPYMLKVDSLGNYGWSKTFVNMPNADFRDVVQVNTSDYVITGDDTLNSFILETDYVGNSLWFKHYDYTAGVSTIVSLSDMGFATAGGDFLLRTDSSGNLKWIKYYDFSNHPVSIRSMINTIDGGFALTGDVDTLGNLNYFIPLIKTDAMGNVQWYKYFGSNNYDVGYWVRQTNDNGYIIAGLKDSLFGGTRSYLIKTDSGGFANPIAIKINSSKVIEDFIVEQNYPNPFNPITIISFSVPLNKGGFRGLFVRLVVYDILGREVATLVNQEMKPGSYKVKFDGSNYASGLYFYRLEAGSFVEVKKMVLVK